MPIWPIVVLAVIGLWRFATHLTVYWKELEGEDHRRVIELMLDSVLKPVFREWK